MNKNESTDRETALRLQLLKSRMEHFSKVYGYELHVKDFTGYMVGHPVLGEFVNSFLYHRNDFCNLIKSNQAANRQCAFTSNELLLQRIRAVVSETDAALGSYINYTGMDRGFFGVCWCGVREYVYPIIHSRTVIGALLVGDFRAEDGRVSHCFDRLERKYGFSKNDLHITYKGSTLAKPDLDIAVQLETAFLADYLSMIAEQYIDHTLISFFSKSCCGKDKNHKRISSAIDYITKNISGKITVSDIADYCFCSNSTLTHLFSRMVGKPISEFITIQRVNRAKYLLPGNSLSIEQISRECGFSSSAYFSTVFKEITGMPPNKYREKTNYISR